jgi:Fe-S-cluster containining protein
MTADLQLTIGDWRLQAKLSVPAGPTRLIELLPVFQSVDNAVVDLAVQQAEEEGETISCRKGCGACCRQMVPIAEVEARRIRDLVSDLPEPRRSEIRTRFAEARRRLEQAGLLDKLLERAQWTEEEVQALGIKYFFQGIPCPFLEEESCSIHPDRPLACREYLVTSPAAHCAQPAADTIRQVKIPLKVWTTVAQFDKPEPGARFIRWVPLILAPEWADAHPEEPPPRPGPELVNEFLSRLTGKNAAATQTQQPPAEPVSPPTGPPRRE